MKPLETTKRFTSYKCAMEIFRCVRNARRWNCPLPMNFDFVYHQPQLSDFKFIFENEQREPQRQVFVQNKYDGEDRTRGSKLTKVGIARSKDDGRVSWYLNPFERYVVCRNKTLLG